MATEIAKLRTVMTLQTKQFTTGMKRMRGETRKFRKQVSATTGLVKKLGLALIGVAGARAMGRFISGQLKAIDSLAKVSRKLGLTTEALAGFRLAAELTGVNTQTLDMALQRMSRRLAEASMGTGEAKDALKELGINAERLAGLGTEQAFLKIADAISKVENPMQRLRLAFKIWDSEGVAMVNTAALGSKGLARLKQQAIDMGLAMSGDAAAGVVRANDAILVLKKSFVGLGRTLVVEFAEPLAKAGKFLTQAAKNFRLGLGITPKAAKQPGVQDLSGTAKQRLAEANKIAAEKGLVQAKAEAALARLNIKSLTLGNIAKKAILGSAAAAVGLPSLAGLTGEAGARKQFKARVKNARQERLDIGKTQKKLRAMVAKGEEFPEIKAQQEAAAKAKKERVRSFREKLKAKLFEIKQIPRRTAFNVKEAAAKVRRAAQDVLDKLAKQRADHLRKQRKAAKQKREGRISDLRGEFASHQGVIAGISREQVTPTVIKAGTAAARRAQEQASRGVLEKETNKVAKTSLEEFKKQTNILRDLLAEWRREFGNKLAISP